ncbi:MAG: ABC transporter permease subunit [Bacteroidetes bacterium]|nr:ABC transporter permease subunit [Bacteroidota bacterium]
MSILVLIRLTLRELSSKVTMYILAGISTLVLLGLALAVSVDSMADGEVLKLFGQQVSPPVPLEELAKAVQQMQAGLAGGLFTGIILFGVFATAGVIPDMLERGTVDLYISKPISRWELLLGKYCGAVAAIGLNIIYFLAGAWLVFGLRCGVWDINLLLSALTMTFMFAALYAMVVFFGTWTRSTAASIILTYLYLFILGGILHNRELTLYLISENAVYRGVIDGFYYLFPQISGMQENGAKQIMQVEMDWKPFLQSFFSGSVFFLAAAVILKRRDF